MSVGQINTVVPGSGNTCSGDLSDLDTGAKLRFQDQSGNLEVGDVVDYTDKEGTAVDLLENLKVKTKNFETASREVQGATKALLSTMAKDKNMTDINVKKI